MFMWIYDLPTGPAALLFAVAFVVVNSLGIILIRPILRPLVADLRDENDLIGHVLSLYSVMFGLLLGMLAIVTYQNLADAQKSADNEATAVTALYRDVSTYPEPHKGNLQAAVREYTRYVIEEAWPLQQKGLVPKGGIALVDTVQKLLADFEPTSNAHVALHQETLRQYNNFVVQRRARLNAVNAAIPPILWQTMLGGALVCMMLMWLFETTKVALHLLSGIAAFALGSMIGLIALMDNPFRGELSVSADSYKLAYETLMNGKPK